MKRVLLHLTSILVAATSFAMLASAPVALDWHSGGHLCVLYKGGSIAIVDEVKRLKLTTIPPAAAFDAASIVSAKLHDRECIFVSGFFGRTGAIVQYDLNGHPLAKFQTPEQAASFDVDPGTTSGKRLLYLASPITNLVYVIDLDRKGSSARRVTYLREATSLGPVIFDQGRNRLIVGDTGRGAIYEVDPRRGSYQQIGSDFGRPISFAFDAGFKTLYVADYMNGLVHVMRLGGGVFKRVESIPTNLRRLSGIAEGPSDTLFVTDGNAGVLQLDPKTKKLSQFLF